MSVKKGKRQACLGDHGPVENCVFVHSVQPYFTRNLQLKEADGNFHVDKLLKHVKDD